MGCDGKMGWCVMEDGVGCDGRMEVWCGVMANTYGAGDTCPMCEQQFKHLPTNIAVYCQYGGNSLWWVRASQNCYLLVNSY